jgi:hypothetical protein
MERMMETDNDSLVLDLSNKISALKGVWSMARSSFAEVRSKVEGLTAPLPFNTHWIPSLQLTIGIGDEVRSQNAFLDDMVRVLHIACMGVT